MTINGWDGNIRNRGGIHMKGLCFYLGEGMGQKVNRGKQLGMGRNNTRGKNEKRIITSSI